MGQLARDRVPHGALAAATLAPAIRLDDPAGQHRTVRLKPSPVNFQAELIQPGERGQARAREGRVRHVEVFQMGCVRTPILG